MIEGLINIISLVLNITISVNQESSLDNPVLKIPKIELTQEFYPDDKIKNNVDLNIQVIEGSTMPDKPGNLILASHSGSSAIAYFKHLDQLSLNDLVYVYYQDKIYEYKIAKIYDVYKTGYVAIKREQNKKTITLITCKKNTNKQTVYIGYQSA